MKLSNTADDRIDDLAFRQELLALVPYMRALARSYARNPTDADDIVQDALLSAWRHRDRFELGTNMRAWLSRIVRNGFLLRVRNAWRAHELTPELAERELVTGEAQTPALELKQVRQALYSLSVVHREVLMMSAGGFSYDEIAEICDCPIGTVRSRINRARAALQKTLDEAHLPPDATPALDTREIIIEDIQRLRRVRGGGRGTG